MHQLVQLALPSVPLVPTSTQQHVTEPTPPTIKLLVQTVVLLLPVLQIITWPVVTVLVLPL